MSARRAAVLRVMAALPALTALGLVASVRDSFAQRARETPAGSVPAAVAAGRCVVRATSVEPRDEAAQPDATVSPVLAPAGDGVLVAWRARAPRASVWVASIVAGTSSEGPLARRADEREVTGPARAFDLTSAPTGATLAAIEHTARGDEVLLARLDARGLALNVPRVVGRVREPEGLSISWNELGYIVAFGARGSGGDATDAPESLEPRERAESESLRAGTYVVSTDARGVPRERARRVSAGRNPVLAYAPATQSDRAALALAVGGATNGVDPALVLLDENARALDAYRWPLAARALAPLTMNNAPGFFSVSLSEGGVLSLVRASPGSAPTETPLAYRTALGASAVAADRAGPVLLIAEAGGRELLVRASLDGAAQPLAVRVGTRGALTAAPDGSLYWAGFDASARLRVAQVLCPRPSVAAPSQSALGALSGLPASADGGTTRDASLPDASENDAPESGASL